MPVPSSHEAFIRNNTGELCVRSLDQQANDELPPLPQPIAQQVAHRDHQHQSFLGNPVIDAQNVMLKVRQAKDIRPATDFLCCEPPPIPQEAEPVYPWPRRPALQLDDLTEDDITAGAQAIAQRAGLGPWSEVHPDYQRFLTGDVRTALKAIRDRHL